MIDGRRGEDALFGDNVNFAGEATVGTAGGRDRLLSGTGDDTLRGGPANDILNGGQNTDNCDGEAGNRDIAIQCESVNGIP